MNQKPDIRILYIEDEHQLCGLFMAVVEVHGYRVDIASTGEDGIAFSNKTNYSAVAIDSQLPDMAGIEIARKLLAENPNLPLLMVTSKSDQRLAVEAMALGIVNYVIKDRGKSYLELIPSLIGDLLKRSNQRHVELEAEKAVLESERRYRTLVASSPICIHEIDIEGNLISMNQAGLDMMKAKDESEICGLRYLNVPILEDKERIRALMDRAFQGQSSKFEFSAQGEDGLLHFSSSFVPIKDEDGKVIKLMGVTQDITQQREIEEKLYSALADAENANEAKSEFLATMSHEFRTPLNAILGFSEMLRAQYFGPLGSETYKEYAKDIYESGGHMLALVNDMLDVAAIEAGKRQINKEPLDVNEIAERCLKDVEHTATEKGINLSLRVSDDVPPLNADKRSLVQILHNILSNAVKFTEHDGTIEVVASMIEGSVTLCVRDSGVGIAPENLPKIAEPFSQSHDEAYISRDGTGLGLSIVKSLVELHEGTLSIESELGKGTTVMMLFPNQ